MSDLVWCFGTGAALGFISLGLGFLTGHPIFVIFAMLSMPTSVVSLLIVTITRYSREYVDTETPSQKKGAK